MITVIPLIKKILEKPQPISDAMKQIIEYCKRNNPHLGWDSFLSLPYDNLLNLQQWLEKVFTAEPIEGNINGIWFGIFNPEYEKGPTCDMYVGGSAEYSEDDIEWACDLVYWPQNGYAHSEILVKIHALAQESGLKNKAEYPLCLAYSCFAVLDLMKHTDPSLIINKNAEIGIAVGFDDGDYIVLGKLTKNGFVLSNECR